MTESSTDHSELLALTSDIVAAHVSKNSVSTAELPSLIETVYKQLSRIVDAGSEPEVELKPAVPIKKSVHDDHLVCLEDGKKLKMLKRHLKTAYNMTPQEYRAKWGLSPDYPMVAPAYARKRRDLAKKIGLGRKPAGQSKAKAKAS